MYQWFTNYDVRLKKSVSIDNPDSEHNFAITFFINQKPKIMKKLIASICSLMLVFSTTAVLAAMSKDDIKTAPIIIRTGGGESGNTRPRTPAFIPITGMYDDGRVILNFIEEIGTLNITVANQSTGEMYFDCCDSADGHFEIEISASKGNYLLTIQTENGTTYYGEFTL